MIKRSFWIEKIKSRLKKKNILWLAGVRRVGKTYLCKSLDKIEYFDCEIPKDRHYIEDTEAFLNKVKGKTVVIDEIHRLKNPSEILKIAADYHKKTNIIATGSSMLGASIKFKDTLTDRKTTLWLTPMIKSDLEDFKNKSLEHRYLHGGLPPFFLSKNLPEENFQDWMDSYWAKDIQELFRLLNKFSFQRFAELLFIQSGGIFEATKFTRPCEVSRTAINNYLKVLEETFVIHVIKPFSTYKATEITKAPKAYSFDTGLMCFYKNWDRLRRDDMGILWEHFVLNEILAHTQSKKVYYWRDKRGHEVDFILQKKGKDPIAIECKWSSNNFESNGIQAFRRQYPKGKNYVVAQDVSRSFSKTYGETTVDFISLDNLIKEVIN